MEPGDDEPRRQALLRPLGETLHAAGHEHLLRCGDEVMASLAGRLGPLGERERRRGRPEEPYGALVRTIVGQQLSTKAAATIYGRLILLFGERPPTPEELLAADEDAMRAAGLSRPKISYLRDLARHVIDGELDLHTLEHLSDEEVSSRITAVKGLGQWSADMFLMFHLRRPDVLPVGDLGVRRSVERNYGLADLPSPDGLVRIAEPWRPHRTLACLYLWEALDAAPVGSGTT